MISKRYFGSHRGREVYAIILDNGLMQAEILNYGATIRRLVVKGTDVCLGYDHLGQYISCDGYIGACVGRNANRISGSRFNLNGKEYILSANEGANQLHGGKEGFSHKLWDFRFEGESVVFSLFSPDGDEGYPGNLNAEIRFSLDNTALKIDYKARADRDTVVNFTNHAYFNLGGHSSGPVYEHRLQINAENYTPCGTGNIPTGSISPLEGSPLDMRSERTLGDILCDSRLADTVGLDHNFVLSSSHACSLSCPESGIRLDVYTGLEGMQVYSAGFLTARRGKNGCIYAPHHAICLETQHFPDAVNNPAFPSPILRAGEEYHEYTEFVFSDI